MNFCKVIKCGGSDGKSSAVWVKFAANFLFSLKTTKIDKNVKSIFGFLGNGKSPLNIFLFYIFFRVHVSISDNGEETHAHKIILFGHKL